MEMTGKVTIEFELPKDSSAKSTGLLLEGVMEAANAQVRQHGGKRIHFILAVENRSFIIYGEYIEGREFKTWK